MVGFNRRFAPHAQRMRALLSGVAEPKSFVMTVNAGAVPPEHWTQDRRVGGGRIVGEACHFIDLLRFLAGSPIKGFRASSMGPAPGIAVTDDKASIILNFEDGSIGTILYLANGHRSFPKERLEVLGDGEIAGDGFGERQAVAVIPFVGALSLPALHPIKKLVDDHYHRRGAARGGARLALMLNSVWP